VSADVDFEVGAEGLLLGERVAASAEAVLIDALRDLERGAGESEVNERWFSCSLSTLSFHFTPVRRASLSWHWRALIAQPDGDPCFEPPFSSPAPQYGPLPCCSHR